MIIFNYSNVGYNILYYLCIIYYNISNYCYLYRLILSDLKTYCKFILKAHACMQPFGPIE